MKSTALVAWIGVLFMAALAYGSWRYWKSQDILDRYDIPPSPSAPMEDVASIYTGPVRPFQLTDQLGRKFDSQSLKGRVWVGSFFFASCPGPCRQLNQALAAMDKQFGPQGVKFVSITCDPKNDTPTALKRYADIFQADPSRWFFLTGDMARIGEIGRDFKLVVMEGTHSEKAVVIDRKGTVRGLFNLLYPDHADKMRKLLQKVLAEAPPAAVSAAKSSGQGAVPSATKGSTSKSAKPIAAETDRSVSPASTPVTKP